MLLPFEGSRMPLGVALPSHLQGLVTWAAATQWLHPYLGSSHTMASPVPGQQPHNGFTRTWAAATQWLHPKLGSHTMA